MFLSSLRRIAALTVFSLVLLPSVEGRDCGIEIDVSPGPTPVAYKVSLFQDTKGEDLASLFRGLRADSLPCSTYKYELRRTDIDTTAGRIVGEVTLQDTNQHLNLQADRTLVITPNGVYAGDNFAPDYSLRVVVKGLAEPIGQPWARLVAITTNTAREVQIGADGSFQFFRPEPGAYVLLIVNSDQLLAAKYIKVGRTSVQLEISLTDN